MLTQHIQNNNFIFQTFWNEGRKIVLFNDALNTFYLRLYGVRHMVKDLSDSEKVNPLPPHRLSFRLTARVLLYAPSQRQDSTYHGLCYTSRGELAGTRRALTAAQRRLQVPYLTCNIRKEGNVLFNDAHGYMASDIW